MLIGTLPRRASVTATSLQLPFKKFADSAWTCLPAPVTELHREHTFPICEEARQQEAGIFKQRPYRSVVAAPLSARSDIIIVLWRLHTVSSMFFCGQRLSKVDPDAVSTPLCALTEVHYRRRKHRPPVVSSQTWSIPHVQDELSFDAEDSGKVQRIGGTPTVDHPCSVC